MKRHLPFSVLVVVAAAFLSFLCDSSPTNAANITWKGTLTNDWNTTGNWSPNTSVPDSAGETAYFNGTGTNAVTFTATVNGGLEGILVDSGQVSALSVSNTANSALNFRLGNGAGITINPGAGAFTMQATGGASSGIQLILNSTATYTFLNNSSNTATISLGTTASSQIIGGGGTIPTVAFDGSGDWVLNTKIVNQAGATPVTKNGAGTLTLNVANTYTGSTTVSGGTLLYGINDAISSGAVTVNGATAILDLGANHTDSVGTVTLQGGGQIKGTGTSALTSTGSFAVESGSASAILAGGVALNKTTAGTVTLSGANTYTGGTTIGAGTLKMSGSGTLGATTGTLTVNGGTLDLNGTSQGAGNFTGAGGTLVNNATGTNVTFTIGNNNGTGGDFQGVIADHTAGTGTVALSKTGAGTIILSGANTYTGNTTIGGGTLQLGNGGATGSLSTSSAIVNNGNLTINRSNAVAQGADFTGSAITGSGSLTKAGAGALTLTVGNSFGGGTNVNGGTLVIGANDALVTTGAVTLNSTGSGTTPVTLDLSNFSQTIGSLNVRNTNAVNADTITIGGGKILTVNGNVTMGANSTSTTLANISGAGTFAVNSAGGTFQVGGGTGGSVNQATLDMTGLANFTAALGTAGSFRVGDANSASSAATGVSLVKLATATTITAGTVDIGGTTLHAGTQTLKLGSGTQTINANTITLGVDSSSRSGGEISFNTAAGTLKIRSATDPVNGRAALNVLDASNGTGTNLSGVFDVTGHNADLKLSTLNIGNRNLGSSSAPGTTDGTFSFDTGTLDVTSIVMGIRSNNNNASNVTATLNIGGGAVTIGSIGPLGQNNNSVGTGSAIATVNIAGGTVNIGSISNMALNGGANGLITSTLNFTGGTITLAGNITRTSSSGSNATATLNLNGATLDMGGNSIGGAGGLALTNGNFMSGTLKNLAQFNNGATLTKTTTGTLIMDGANAYTGATIVSGGVLEVRSNTALGTIAGGTTVSNGATLRLAVNSYSMAEPLTLNGPGYGGLAETGALLVDGVGMSRSFAGPITLGSNATIGVYNGSTLTLTGGINKNGNNVTFLGDNTGSKAIINTTPISGLADVIVNAMTVDLNVANTYTGPTLVQNNGQLNLNVTDALPSPTFSAVTIQTGSTMNRAGGASNTAASLALNNGAVSGSGTLVLAGNVTSDNTSSLNGGTTNLNGNRTFAVNSGTLSVSDALVGVGNNLTKQGAGAMVVTGTNTYSGQTKVDAGTFELASPGSLQNSAVNVNGGTFLQSGGTNNVTGVGGGDLTITAAGAYLLTGGTLDFHDYSSGSPSTWTPDAGRASTISMPTGAQFSFTGGTLQDVSTITVADNSAFTQNGGDFYIGQQGIGPAAETTINGGFSLLEGVIHFDAFGADLTPEQCCDGVASQNDQLTVNGDLLLDSLVTLNFTSYTPDFGDAFTLFCADTITLGDNFGLSGGFFRIIPDGQGGFALQAIVPEPASVAVWTIIGMIGVAGAWRLRRKCPG